MNLIWCFMKRREINLNSIAKLIFLFLFVFLPTATGQKQTQLENIAKSLKPGEWYLLKRPAINVLPSKKELNTTTWGGTGSGSVIFAWNGAAYDKSTKNWYFHGGGHNNYGGNGVYSFNFLDLTWKTLKKTYILPDSNIESPCPQPLKEQQGPPSSHTYDSVIWSKKTNTLWYWNRSAYCRSKYAKSSPGIWNYVPDTNQWKKYTNLPDKQFKISTAELPNGNIVLVDRSSIYLFDPLLQKIKKSSKSMDWGEIHQLVYLPEENKLLLNEWTRLFIIDPITLKVTKTIKKPLDAKIKASDGIAFHNPSGRIVFWDGKAQIVTLNLEKMEWGLFQDNNKQAPDGLRPQSKWMYLNDLDLFTGVSGHKDGVWFYKLPPSKSSDTFPLVSTQEQIDKKNQYHILLNKNNYRHGAIIKRNHVIIDGNGSTISGVVRKKGVLLIQGDNVTVQNMTLRIGNSAQNNQACIRIEGKNTTIRNITCTDAQMGILTGGNIGNLTFDNIRIERSGISPKGNLGHMIYACSNGKCGPHDKLTVKNSLFKHIGINRPGHALKSRAPINIIVSNLFDSGKGHSGRMIDLPQGGDNLIFSNHFIQQEDAENNDIIGIWHERDKKRFSAWSGVTVIKKNTFSCLRSSKCSVFSAKARTGDKVEILNNVLEGDFRKIDIENTKLTVTNKGNTQLRNSE